MNGKCVSCGSVSELNKFVLLMQTLGKEPTAEKFEVFKNRGGK